MVARLTSVLAMSADHVCWMSLWQRLNLRTWFPQHSPSTSPCDPSEPEPFLSQAKDYSGAWLFDSNTWIEEQHLLIQHPPIRSFDNEISTKDPLLLKSCVPLTVEEGLFLPLCPVLQHQPRVKIEDLVVESPDILEPQSPPLPLLEYTPETSLPPVSVMVGVLLFVLYCFVLLCCCCCYISSPGGNPIEENDQQIEFSQAEESSESFEKSLNTLLRSKLIASKEDEKALVTKLRQEQAITGFFRNLNQWNRQDRSRLHEEISLLEEEQQRLSGELDTKRQHAADLTKDKEDLRQQLRTRNKEIEILMDDEAKLESAVRKQEATIRELEVSIGELNTKSEHLRYRVDSKKREITNLNKEKSDLVDAQAREIATKNAEIASLQAEVLLKDVEVQELQTSNDVLQEKWSSQETGKQAELNSLSGEVLQNQEMLMSQAAQLEHTILTNEQLTKDKEILQENAENAESRMQEDSQWFQEKMAAAATQLAESKEKISGLSSLNQALDAKVRHLRRKSAVLQRKSDLNGLVENSIALDLEETKAALKIQAEQVEDLAEEKRALNEKLARMACYAEKQAEHTAKLVSSRDSQIHDDEVKISTLQTELLRKDDHIDYLAKKIYAMEEEHEMLAGKLGEREDMEMIRKRRITESEAHVRLLEKQIRSLHQTPVNRPLDTQLDKEAESAAPVSDPKILLPALERPSEEPSRSSSATEPPSTSLQLCSEQLPPSPPITEAPTPEVQNDGATGEGELLEHNTASSYYDATWPPKPRTQDESHIFTMPKVKKGNAVGPGDLMKSKFAPTNNEAPEPSSAVTAVNEAASTTRTTTPKRYSFRPEAAVFTPAAAPIASATPSLVRPTPSAPTGSATPAVAATPQEQALVGSGFTPVASPTSGFQRQGLTNSRWANAPATPEAAQQGKMRPRHSRAPMLTGDEDGTSTHNPHSRQLQQIPTPPALSIPPATNSNNAQGSSSRGQRLRLRVQVPSQSQAPSRGEHETLIMPLQRQTGSPSQATPRGAPSPTIVMPGNAGSAARGGFEGRRGHHSSHHHRNLHHNNPYPANNNHRHNNNSNNIGDQEQQQSQGRGRGRGNREAKIRRGNKTSTAPQRDEHGFLIQDDGPSAVPAPRPLPAPPAAQIPRKSPPRPTVATPTSADETEEERREKRTAREPWTSSSVLYNPLEDDE